MKLQRTLNLRQKSTLHLIVLIMDDSAKDYLFLCFIQVLSNWFNLLGILLYIRKRGAEV